MFSSTGSNHPIIPKQTNLYLTPNYVTFHSEDRDETKYSSASQWATRLPQNINNIRSMHLVDCYLPTRHMFVFKNDYQNLAFMIRMKISGANDCLIEKNNLYDNCSKESKCTPRLNLSRPLVPHSNVKFNEDTKQDYAGINNNGPYQIPTSQLQNNFSAPKDCTSYENNLDGLNDLYDYTCENKKKKCPNKKSESEPEPEPEPEAEPEECKLWAPRSMCEQETALLRVNGTVPPYVRQMRENEDRVQKGEQPMEFNYDGCNAFCNHYDYTGKDCAYYMIRIKEGMYTGNELAQHLQDVLQNTLFPTSVAEWKVHFSPVNCRLYFYLVKGTNPLPDIEFRFDWKINYYCQNFNNKNQPEVWNNKHWWGLGYYLGFDKNNYAFKNTTLSNIINSQINTDDVTKLCSNPLIKGTNVKEPTSPSDNDDYFLKPPNHFSLSLFDGIDKEVNGLVSCRSVNIEGPSVLYMEVEKYNNCDEITPGPSNTNSSYNNTFSGKPKTIFAKIEVTKAEGYKMRNDIQYITHMKNFLEERINKLEFKFRFGSAKDR